MISKRLLEKLQIGKKYLITHSYGGLYVLDIQEKVIWCSEIGWNSQSFGIYKKDWQEILDENTDDREYYHDIKYNYDRTQPTYRFSAHIMKCFVSASTDLSLYDLFFLGEYKEDIDIDALKKYCNIFRISHQYSTKKERLKGIYKNQ